jgi:hypothetical protein
MLKIKKKQLYAVLTVCAVVMTAVVTYRQLNPAGRYADVAGVASVLDTVTGTVYRGPSPQRSQAQGGVFDLHPTRGWVLRAQ